MDDSKIKKINETKKIQEQKEAIIAEYDCSKHCRSCPFPGAKCVNNPEMWKYIK